jgi:hypothetical protein
MQKKSGIKWYSVYNQKGEHQASYDQYFTDAYVWAMDCAKHIGGYICECEVGQEEKTIFNALKKHL